MPGDGQHLHGGNAPIILALAMFTPVQSGWIGSGRRSVGADRRPLCPQTCGPARHRIDHRSGHEDHEQSSLCVPVLFDRMVNRRKRVADRHDRAPSHSEDSALIITGTLLPFALHVLFVGIGCAYALRRSLLVAMSATSVAAAARSLEPMGPSITLLAPGLLSADQKMSGP